MFPAAKSLFPLTQTNQQSTDTDWVKSNSYVIENPSATEDNSILSKRSRDDQSSSESSVESADDTTGNHRKAMKKFKKKRSHKKKHHKSRKKDINATESLKNTHKPATIWIEETNFTPKDAYRLDTHSDTSNFSYDSLYTGHITNYQRRFGNYCLGLAGNSSLKFTDQRNYVPKKKKINLKQHRYYENRLCDSSTIILHTRDKQEDNKMDAKEFLVIETHPIDDEENAEVLSPESYLMKQTGEYNTHLLNNPHDIQLWVEFIKFQEEALIWGALPFSQPDDINSSKTSGSLRQQRLALNERKIAIYERALEKNPLSEVLLVGHLGLVQEVWDTERLVKQWKDIVFKQPNRSLLWLKYIEFCQSHFSFYRSLSLMTLYQKAISTLSSILDQSLLSHKPEQDAESKLLVVFILYCYFLKHSGFVENAIALFQALIEFNLCVPDGFLASEKSKDRRDIFEAFWDKGAARVGEEGALGWKHWWEIQSSRQTVEHRMLGAVNLDEYNYIVSKDEVVNDIDSTDKEINVVKDLPCNVAWAKLEMVRDLAYCFPGKLTSDDKVSDPDNGSDPDHTVLFDDIAQCLFILQDPDLKATLVLEFLRFLGAPITTVPHVTSTFPDLIQMIVTPSEVMNPSDVPAFRATKPPSIIYQPRLITSDLTSVCEMPLYNLMCPSSSDPYPVSLPLKAFVTQLFNHCLSLLQTLNVSSEIISILICSWLHSELQYLHTVTVPSQIKNVSENLQTLAVTLLQSVSLCDYEFLWNFVTELEPFLAQKKKISSLSKSFLSPFAISPIPHGSPLFVFCLLFVECMLKLRKPMNCYSKHEPSHSLALFALVTLSSGDFNPTMLPVSGFKVTRPQLDAAMVYFNDLSDHVLSTSGLSMVDSISRLSCCFYFKYLTNGIEPACQLMGQIIHSLLMNNSLNTTGCIELLYVIEVKLVQLHSESCPIKPQILRNILHSALEQFPNHFLFLSAFIKSEERSFITGQVRRYFNSLTQRTGNTLIPCLFAIQAELSRHHRLNQLVGEYLEEPTSALVQRIRSFFIRGSQSSICQLCPVLWRLYIKFEIEYGSKDKAKSVFYQAIQQCPWVKVLYFDGANYFPEESEKIMEIVEEKELRLRTPLEEVKLLQEMN